MKSVNFLICAMAIALRITSLAAQDKPDFSGQWTIAPAAEPAGARGPARGDMGSGWGSPLTVTQTADRLTVQYAFFGRGDMQPPLKFIYALDGTETKNTVMMGQGIQGQISKTRWEGNKLVITTIHTFTNPQNGQPMTSEVRQILSLESRSSLLVETTRSGVLGGSPSTTRTMYSKN
jgi:hypothetical protein